MRCELRRSGIGRIKLRLSEVCRPFLDKWLSKPLHLPKALQTREPLQSPEMNQKGRVVQTGCNKMLDCEMTVREIFRDGRDCSERVQRNVFLSFYYGDVRGNTHNFLCICDFFTAQCEDTFYTKNGLFSRAERVSL